MRIVYDKQTYEIVLIEEDDSSFISTPHGIFYGSVEEFINFVIVSDDQDFGKLVTKTFLAQNRSLSLSPGVNVELLRKFDEIERLLNLGDLKTSRYLVSVLPVDEIFSQGRKDRFLGLLDQYLNA
jgi:hypothetical protein